MPEHDPNRAVKYDGSCIGNRTDPNWPLSSFDARDWAKAFVETMAKNGHPGIDESWMVSWFANALMRGYDEHRWHDRNDGIVNDTPPENDSPHRFDFSETRC